MSPKTTCKIPVLWSNFFCFVFLMLLSLFHTYHFCFLLSIAFLCMRARVRACVCLFKESNKTKKTRKIQNVKPVQNCTGFIFCTFYAVVHLEWFVSQHFAIYLCGLSLNVPFNNFQSCRDGSSWEEPVLSSG